MNVLTIIGIMLVAISVLIITVSLGIDLKDKQITNEDETTI